MATNLFKKAVAKTVDTPKVAKEKKEVYAIDGLEELAQVDALIKALTSLKSTLGEEVKEQALDRFAELGNGKRPENFKGVDGDATASMELRKRSTASVLTEEEVAYLESMDIPVEKITTQQMLFGVNPAYASDEALLEKVSAKIEKLVPEDFFIVQEGKEKTVVGDKTIERAFEIAANKATRKTLINIVGVMAVKPKLAKTDMSVIMDNLKNLIAAQTTNDE